jgi:hypothetical protein
MKRIMSPLTKYYSNNMRGKTDCCKLKNQAYLKVSFYNHRLPN